MLFSVEGLTECRSYSHPLGSTSVKSAMASCYKLQRVWWEKSERKIQTAVLARTELVRCRRGGERLNRAQTRTVTTLRDEGRCLSFSHSTITRLTTILIRPSPLFVISSTRSYSCSEAPPSSNCVQQPTSSISAKLKPLPPDFLRPRRRQPAVLATDVPP